MDKTDTKPDPGKEPKAPAQVQCAVLCDNIYGRHDDIITLPAAQAEAAAAAGYVDTHPAAIAAIQRAARSAKKKA